MIITFTGHSSMNVSNELSEKIKNTIKSNIQENNKVIFYCGGYGDFDSLCARVCKDLKSEIPASEVAFVTPYITHSQQKKLKYLLETKLYDTIIYPPLENIPFRFAISKRNEWMISESDLVIAYVKYTYGGAYKTLEYARRKKKTIINLAE